MIQDLEFEFWLPISGYESIYLISNQKRIKSLKRKWRPEERLMKLTVSPKGYYTIGLTQDKEVINKYFHILYATAFLPNPNNLPQVNHLDGNKLNNELWNLEWATAQRNILHARETGLNKTKVGSFGEKNPSAKLTKNIAAIIRASSLTDVELAYAYKVSTMTIYFIRAGKIWKDLFKPVSGEPAQNLSPLQQR